VSLFALSQNFFRDVLVVAREALILEVAPDFAYLAFVHDSAATEKESVLGLFEHGKAVGDEDHGRAILFQELQGAEDVVKG
jgi:hypothetical protein